MCPWISVHPLLAAALTGAAAPALAGEKTNWPNYREGDFVIADYTIASTETLPPRQDISRGTESLQTHRWREVDSNSLFRAKSTVNPQHRSIGKGTQRVFY